jgi:single-strand DNA-binding protein
LQCIDPLKGGQTNGNQSQPHRLVGTTDETTPPTIQSRRRGPSLNQVSLIGRLVADPQLRHTPNGVAVTNFRVASNGAYETQFHTIVAWRGLGAIADAWLRKGRLIVVSGRLRGRSWKAADGSGTSRSRSSPPTFNSCPPRPLATRRRLRPG